jgi:molybdopterin synthase sulfur carrier subunit
MIICAPTPRISGFEAMRLLYFARVRELVGLAEEEVSPPPSVRDVAGLLEWLKARGERYGRALSATGRVHVAVNARYAKPGDPVSAEDEVALFPPVTGGLR